ncbi:MAG TPA: MarR family transcriptional regulator [Candidatus Methylacidiphilales bacterium]|jgi:DNA-binding MarR family transcriptional regulator|nr:MarR family transcriptional regulator [Candidatus Methylacidiphilales bacterium]
MNGIEDAAVRLRTVVRLLKMRAEKLKDKDAPSQSEHQVMVWLDEKGAMTPRALADAQNVRPQTVQQTLDALERRKFITRADHPTDRRQILISISAAGRKELDKARAARQAWLAGELGKLTARELKTVTDALAIIERFLNKPIETPKSK